LVFAISVFLQVTHADVYPSSGDAVAQRREPLGVLLGLADFDHHGIVSHRIHIGKYRGCGGRAADLGSNGTTTRVFRPLSRSGLDVQQKAGLAFATEDIETGHQN